MEVVLYCMLLRKNCPYSETFWSAFSRIQTEYGETLRISPYSVRMRENAGKKILNTDTFHAACFYVISFSILQIHVSKIFFWWKRWSSCKRLISLVPLISLVIRQKDEWQNVCFKKTKHTKISEKRTFLTSWFFRLFKSLYSWRLHDECV